VSKLALGLVDKLICNLGMIISCSNSRGSSMTVSCFNLSSKESSEEELEWPSEFVLLRPKTWGRELCLILNK